VFHTLEDFKGIQDGGPKDRMMATLAMNSESDKEFINDTDVTRDQRRMFLEKVTSLLKPWLDFMKDRHPNHNYSIAVLKSLKNQVTEQLIHVDFDPKHKSDSFSTIIPLNDYCVVNIHSTGCQSTPLYVNKGFMLEFTAKQAHGGGKNVCGEDQYRIHAYFYTGDSLPKNKVHLLTEKNKGLLKKKK
jgi:hypothetical protein